MALASIGISAQTEKSAQTWRARARVEMKKKKRKSIKKSAMVVVYRSKKSALGSSNQQSVYVYT